MSFSTLILILVLSFVVPYFVTLFFKKIGRFLDRKIHERPEPEHVEIENRKEKVAFKKDGVGTPYIKK